MGLKLFSGLVIGLFLISFVQAEYFNEENAKYIEVEGIIPNAFIERYSTNPEIIRIETNQYAYKTTIYFRQNTDIRQMNIIRRQIESIINLQGLIDGNVAINQCVNNVCSIVTYGAITPAQIQPPIIPDFSEPEQNEETITREQIEVSQQIESSPPPTLWERIKGWFT